MRFLLLPLFAALACACAAGSNNDGGVEPLDSSTGATDTGGGDAPALGDTGTGLDDTATVGFDTNIDAGSTNTTSLIYAVTDVDMWTMDPSTKAVTRIGPFSGTSDNVTDVAVNGNGDVFVNTETAIYEANVPKSPGTVALTLHTQLPSSSKFFALGFTPAGVLETGESLVAGDGAGNLYFIDQTSSAVQELGSFGTFKSGDPNPSGKSQPGDQWTLSGDVVFYMEGSTPRGLATLRTCYTKSGSTTCNTDNDVLAEVDMGALSAAYKAKSVAPNLTKAFISGSNGTGYGRLFGVGAWEDSVYAFARYSSGGSGGSPTPPQLVQISSAGNGVVLQTFGTGASPQFTNGWSGAGVTTKADITIIH